MPTPQELEQKFWKSIRSDMTVMLGLSGVEDGHARPMTAQIEKGDHGPIWFFTAKDTGIAEALSRGAGGNGGRGAGGGQRAFLAYASKGHDLFAAVKGRLVLDNDRAAIDRLWNRFVAAWFEGGKDDPKLALLRFEPEEAEIWLDDSSFLAGVKMLLGMDPKQEYRDKVATIALD